MQATQNISRTRRKYNKWVGNETLEDYALRFTAKKARRWSIGQVGQTALGATAFLALEAIAAGITLQYGFTNAMLAMLAVALVSFFIGFPISYYAAKHGLDIDLLTRGAGFGYMGSTLTSLIYASFTFIFFAIEAAILSSALNALLGIPLPIAYIICAVAVIPIVTHGITAISRFQIGTQPFWLLLQCLALLVVGWHEIDQVGDWSRYAPNTANADSGGFDLLLFGAASSVLFAFVAQIGEQVDYLRFMPEKTAANRRSWWFWLVLSGPGWIFIGLIKMCLGSFLAYLAVSRGMSEAQAVDPTYMYQTIFNYLTSSPTFSLILAAVMVLISQMKINVTNAYAGSIAWSNFFSRLTHSHPGRVVWLVFNVTIALILMELGIYEALEGILAAFAIVAVSWLGTLAADLMINKPLGLSPSWIEFKRAHLYDINPVGVFSLIIATVLGLSCYLGAFGETTASLAHFISLLSCFIMVPLIGFFTRGRYYLARSSPELDDMIPTCNPASNHELECCLCETAFELEDMSYCPAYQGAICSLCCSLDSRCQDSCKSNARFHEQAAQLIRPLLPENLYNVISSWLAKYLIMLMSFAGILSAILGLIYLQMQPQTAGESLLLRQTMMTLFFIMLIIAGVITWLFLLTHESRVVAHRETSLQTQRLMDEIEAHKETDRALQDAKDIAEQANNAKSRFLTGISHELRTPLQSMLGYAQLLYQRQDMPDQHKHALQIIRRSGEHLANLIEGLLDISKIEAGRLEIYRNEVNMADSIDQMVSMFQEHARSRHIDFNCRIHDPLPELVIADEKRLRQVLINLLSNAFKYTERGSVDFDIHYRNQVATFSVRDTGVGIDPGDIERILNPFERVRNSQVPNVPGTGLGLTIVRLLTEIMGGDLNIESTPGQGSCFSVSLMLPWTIRDGTQASPDRQITGYRGDRRCVFVVDDEPIHRGLLSDLLTPLGFITIEAYNAENCLSLLEHNRADIFLLDVSMPGMSGLELARSLREKGYRQPIAMISADAKEHHLNEHQGFADHDSYIVKPVSFRKLLNCIQDLLEIAWLYADEAPARIAELDHILPAASAGHPAVCELQDHPLMRELLAYARIGYQSGVTAKLKEIEMAELMDTSTLAHFGQLSQNMRFSLMAEEIENQLT